jgi:hypothetical protein
MAVKYASYLLIARSDPSAPPDHRLPEGLAPPRPSPMSFTVHFAVDRRPQQVLADGSEEFQDDAGRWALFEAAEQVGC